MLKKFFISHEKQSSGELPCHLFNMVFEIQSRISKDAKELHRRYRRFNIDIGYIGSCMPTSLLLIEISGGFSLAARE